jgi:dTDP-4-amino-4,6-dideoxygalactose transaminase
MLYQLPPVGNRVCLDSQPGDGAALQAITGTSAVSYYQSGTAALAASITAAIRRRGVMNPEVLLPAYGCPDLVSAAVYAGARPVLVDLEADRPWMDLERVAAGITPQTVAVIAASLCGIPERLAALRQLTGPASVALIEDSAQLVPGGGGRTDWQGDLVVLSFGRGKPVNLLGGGAVLCRDAKLADLLPEMNASADGRFQCLNYRLKASLYNQLISPRLYWLLALFPFLHIGETRYHQLADIKPLDSCRRGYLSANISRYRSRDLVIQDMVSEMLAGLTAGGIVCLPVACGVDKQQPLLRYPLLVEAGLRDRLLDRLHGHGLGASSMYPAVLPGIEGLEDLLSGQGPFPQAERFASRFLTLPTHAGVRSVDIHATEADFRAVMG